MDRRFFFVGTTALTLIAQRAVGVTFPGCVERRNGKHKDVSLGRPADLYKVRFGV
jgi:hypothetical protein